MRITILYIASPSYSGSTLLSRLLHAHNQIVSVGEQQVLSPQISRMMILEERQCTCGVSPLKNCPFWKAIENDLLEKYQLDLQTLDLNTTDPDIFKMHNQAFFDAIHQVSGRSIIVDSSKNWNRLARLKNAGFQIIPIRLQRNMPGVIYSGIKYGQNWLQQCFNYWYYYQKLYAITGPDIPFIRYEPLVQQPQKELSILMRQLTLNFEEKQLNWAAVPNHYIGGNPMRYQKDSQIRIDDTWKRELPWWKKIIIGCAMLFCRLPDVWQFALFSSLSKTKKVLNKWF
ncbi:MAG: hypothetical protein ACI8VT_000064 [Saprospiraceae bacterium]